MKFLRVTFSRYEVRCETYLVNDQDTSCEIFMSYGPCEVLKVHAFGETLMCFSGSVSLFMTWQLLLHYGFCPKIEKAENLRYSALLNSNIDVLTLDIEVDSDAADQDSSERHPTSLGLYQLR